MYSNFIQAVLLAGQKGNYGGLILIYSAVVVSIAGFNLSNDGFEEKSISTCRKRVIQTAIV